MIAWTFAFWLSLAAGAAYGFFLYRPQGAARTAFKTAPVALLASAAWLAGGPPMLVLALALSALGDFFLAFRGERWFLAGLGAFLTAHLAYCALFFAGQDEAWSASPAFFVAVIVVIGLAAGVFARLRPKLGPMRLPVATYSGVIAAMAVAALARGPDPVLLAGVALFMASDMALAFETFPGTNDTGKDAASPRWRPPFIWYAYFAGQALIATAFLWR